MEVYQPEYADGGRGPRRSRRAQRRGVAVETMARGVEAVTQYLFADGRVHGRPGSSSAGLGSEPPLALRVRSGHRGQPDVAADVYREQDGAVGVVVTQAALVIGCRGKSEEDRTVWQLRAVEGRERSVVEPPVVRQD